MRYRENMKIKTVLIGFFALILSSACTNRTVSEAMIVQTPKVTAAPLPESQRKTIAIARFTNDSIQIDELYTDESEKKIRKQVASLLAHHLVVTQRFNIMERQDIGKLNDDDELLGVKKQYYQQNLKDVDALLVGSIVELSNGIVSDKSLSKTNKTHARVAVKLINPKTGEIFYKQEGEGVGKASISTPSILGAKGIIDLDSSIEGKAINAAIVDMVNKIVLTLDTSLLPEKSIDQQKSN